MKKRTRARKPMFASGIMPKIAVTLPKESIDGLDKLAEAHRGNRSAAIRKAIQDSLMGKIEEQEIRILKERLAV